MRVFAQCAAVAIAAAAFIGRYGGTATAQTPVKGDATAVLAAARQALGGDTKLTAVKTVTATGRTRQVRGENLVPIEFEIFIELPDKYLRKDEIPAQESGSNASGFNGDELVQDPPPPPMPAPPPAPAGAPPGPQPMARPNPSAMRVAALKQDFTRLALGMFAASFPSYPLTFTYVAEAEAPQGKADVLEGKGGNNFTLRLFISRDTHLPLMVSWTPPVAPQRGRGPMPMPPGGAATAPPENRLYFADYRDVDGLQFPFRLRRAVGADTIEETIFDRYKVNSKIDAKRFEVRK
jgi:hypothetical protein